MRYNGKFYNRANENSGAGGLFHKMKGKLINVNVGSFIEMTAHILERRLIFQNEGSYIEIKAHISERRLIN
jgi:hypothetical protein